MPLHNMPMARILLTTITRVESFLILQDVIRWTLAFHPFFRKPSTLKQVLVAHPPVLYDQSATKVVINVCSMHQVTHASAPYQPCTYAIIIFVCLIAVILHAFKNRICTVLPADKKLRDRGVC